MCNFIAAAYPGLSHIQTPPRVTPAAQRPCDASIMGTDPPIVGT